jgi:alpha-1,3-rhamnosyl/mannosyltransferase
MVPGVVGGSEEYTTRLLGATAENEPHDRRLTLFVNAQIPGAYPELCAHFETVVAPVSGHRKSVRVLAESTWLAREARRRKLDLMHHLGGIMPFVRATPGMVTVHDLQPLAMPEHFEPTKRAFSQLTIPRSVHAARAVVTLTEFTRQDLVIRLGVDPEKVLIVPSGIRVPDESLELDRVPDVRRRYGLSDRPFFLFPAITYPHKNHLLLVRAFALVHRTHPQAALVLTHREAQMEERLRSEIVEHGLEGSVLRLGRIPREDVDVLYRAATALAFPSRFEGFGLPVLEAMARNCPVLAADATALPEVVGEAGLLLPPDDVGAWAEAMQRLLDDSSERARLSRLGIERAKRFDWHESAVRLESAWSRVLEGVR